MIEKRVIPFGEKMTERNCRLVGYIGQIAVMSNLGAFYEDSPFAPTTNMHVAHLRNLCTQLNEGKYLDVESRISAGHNEVFMHACKNIRLVRIARNGRTTIDGDAQAALNFHGGQADFRIPQDYTAPFYELVDYVTDITKKGLQELESITDDGSDQMTHYLARANGEIAYESKYLTPKKVA